MASTLAFDQAPPLSVPLRFFLTAPVFGMAAGLLLAFSGGEPLANRLHPITLALTHLMVTGLMLQAMIGALFQFVPVVTGGNVRDPLHTSRLIHLCLVLGSPILALAFLTQWPHLFMGASLYLGLGVGGGIVSIGLALWKGEARGETLLTLRGALLALVPTLWLGILLALVLGRYLEGDVFRLLEAHQAWGLGGWSLLLLAGVSWAVVPMFQVTPPYPRLLMRGFMPLVLVAQGLLSLGLMVGASIPVIVAKLLWLAAALGYGLATLRLQARSRRKKGDATRRFFRLAMLCLLLACGLGAALSCIDTTNASAAWETLLGMLLILGGFGSAICGMLYKIVPFLVWLHLQSATARPGLQVAPPNMNQIIPPRSADRQLWLHGLACGCVFVSPWFPSLGHLAGVGLVCAWGYLLWNLLTALAVYRRFVASAAAGGERHAPN